MNEHSDWTEFSIEANGLTLEIALAPQSELDHKIADFIAKSILQANALAGPVHGLITVLVDDDRRIATLNKRWRHIDKPTNVLSFAYPRSPGPIRCIGDIAISYETAARESAAERKPFAHHIAHLSVHGFLHLLGFDHESDSDAEKMERLERSILACVDVPDPYLARDVAG